MSANVRNESARALGAALRGRRMAHGMSLRSLAKQVGLTGHGTLVDYEYGRRIPPEDLIAACEKALDVDDGELCRLRRAALLERADAHAASLLEPIDAASVSTFVPSMPQTDRAVITAALAPDRGWSAGRRWSAVSGVVAALLAVAFAIVAFTHEHQHQAPVQNVVLYQPRLRFGFETPSDRWGILWGQHHAVGAVSDAMHYEGQHSYQVTITGASTTRGYVAFGTTHGLETLHSAMQVTMHLWTSYPRNGVRFFVYGSGPAAVWAQETPYDGSELPVSGGTQWSTLTWTVPRVDQVRAIGIQPYADSDEPRVVAIDAVTW